MRSQLHHLVRLTLQQALSPLQNVDKQANNDGQNDQTRDDDDKELLRKFIVFNRERHICKSH